MKRFWLPLTLCVMLALLTACSTAESASSGSKALSPATPITVEARPLGDPAGLPSGPLLADGQQSGDLLVWLSSTPAQPATGNAQVDTFVVTSSGQPLTDAKVTYDTDMTNMSHGLYLVPTEPAGAGRYTGKVHFSMAGPWRVITIIERPGVPAVRLRFEFRVKDR